jgi:hypothetical protein
MSDTNIEPIMVEDDPTEDQLQLALKQAKREFGDCVADYESDEFEKEFHDQLNLILNEEAISNLIDQDLVTPVVRDDGQIGYLPTAAGAQVGEASLAA